MKEDVIDMNSNNKNIATNIPPNELMKMYRVRKGYSQEKLADLINELSGENMLYQMRVSRYESGKECPEERHKKAIEKILGAKIWVSDEDDK